MKIRLLSILILFASSSLSGQQILVRDNSQAHAGGRKDFSLVAENSVADLLIDINDSKTVHLATKLFAADIERVSGQKAKIKKDVKSASSICVIVGTIDNSSIIKELIKNKTIDVTEIKGKWESCLIQVVANPFKPVEKALVVAGSDRRGATFGLLELSKQMGVSPWYYFADVPPKKSDAIYIKPGRFIQKSPSVKYRGIFINDEMWGLRPWAMNTLAPAEGKGIGPTTYRKIFELLLRLKANFLWPAMHQQTRPFNCYEENKVVADKYGIVMGSSHIEPMLRNNMAGAEWDREYPDEPWDYVKNKKHIYEYWEKRAKENGKYENIYTIGKRGKDDEAGSDITVSVLEQIFADQRDILKKWVNKDIEQVPQVLIPYTEVLGLYNKGLKVPDDVIICWPDDNFGNIRQLPNKIERQRCGGSGIYYHFQWLNGATTAYPWLYTTPLALTWSEMKKAYDHNVRKLWIVNVGDIKPAEIGIEYFMQMAWDISAFEENDPAGFLMDWASRDFGKEYAARIANVMAKHYELGYARRPEHMVMYKGRGKKYTYDWFSITNYNDEAQKRVDEYDKLMKETDEIYDLLPVEKKNSFFQMVSYNVKGAGLHNKKVIYAQKSHAYGQQNRASAAVYAGMAQQAENDIHELIKHYNTEQVTVGDKWDHLASLPGPWGMQWQQWAMPPLSDYSGNGNPKMNIATEGGDKTKLPGFSVYNKDKRFIDLYNTGNGVVYWSSNVSADWIKLSESSGFINDEKRIWVTIDWDKAPKGRDEDGLVTFKWSSSTSDVWMHYESMSEPKKKEYRAGTIGNQGPGSVFNIDLTIFNPPAPSIESVTGFVESNGYISIEAEHYSKKADKPNASWNIIEGLGRTGSSVTVLPTNIPSNATLDDIISKSPVLEYDLYTFTESQVSIQFNCIPSNPINADYGLALAVAVDHEEPIIISHSASRNVMDNLMTLKAKLDMPNQGRHKLKIWMVDPGLVIDKIIIDTGGVKDSYLGPPESAYHNASHAEDQKYTSNGITDLMLKVNNYTKKHPYTKTDRNWIRATYYTGVMGVYHVTKDPAYLEQAREWGQKHQWQVGTEMSGSNRLFCAMTWAQLYLVDSDSKKIAPAIEWLKTDAPNSPGGTKVWYGHAPVPHDKPLYSDSLYGAPVFAMLYKATGDQKYLDIMNSFFWNVTDLLLDKDENLYYRDHNYIGMKSPNGKKILWSRGNGWVFAAFPRILKYLPKDDLNYGRFVGLYKRMAKTLITRQHEDGLWRSNLGDPEHYLMPESSGTAFFAYGLAWGVNQGILDKNVYLPFVIKAWNGLARCVHPSGKLGWVQPVDGWPRPSLPVTTHEYATGLFLLAGSEILKLSRSGVITPDIAGQYLPDDSSILPSMAVKKDSLKKTDHPLADKINIFLKRQQQSKDFAATGFSRKDYLDVIAGQVKAMRKYQDSTGRIIDPVTKEEMYYATPCYAHSVAALAKANYLISKDMIESGMKALDVSLKDLAENKAAGGHGDFYTWPALFAYELFSPTASTQRKEKWSSLIAGINPEKSYKAFRKPYKAYEHKKFYESFGKSWAHNWNLVNTAGEYLRSLHGYTNLEYVDFCLTMQLPHFTSYGMYNEDGNPFAYDLFPRHYVTGMLHRGYRSLVYTTYRDLLWKGAWTSLFIQSPTGQLPTGYRSSHHIWNEAEEAVVFEIYASQYARSGMMAEAGAFKRAAHLALSSVKNWIRPDGSGYIVKNKYPIEARHGYEGYSQHTCYNMLACSMLAQAWQFANDGVKEKPCPADLGGFAVTTPGFHKVFANAGRTYIEYDTSGDHKYNPTGLIRIHLEDGYCQLGPSDGCAPLYSGKGINYAVGPAWKDAKGNWTKLADLSAVSEVKVLEETSNQTRLKITYKIKNPDVTLTELITAKPNEVIVADQISGKDIEQLRIYYPMLTFNGKDKTKIQMSQKTLKMQMENKSVSFEILKSGKNELKRTGKSLKHRNGLVEPVYFDADGLSAKYRIYTEK